MRSPLRRRHAYGRGDGVLVGTNTALRCRRRVARVDAASIVAGPDTCPDPPTPSTRRSTRGPNVVDFYRPTGYTIKLSHVKQRVDRYSDRYDAHGA